MSPAQIPANNRASLMANHLIPQTKGGMFVNNNMMDNQAMANTAEQGKQTTVTPSVQAETQDDSSRKRKRVES